VGERGEKQKADVHILQIGSRRDEGPVHVGLLEEKWKTQ
jgi:hypothetical protein